MSAKDVRDDHLLNLEVRHGVSIGKAMVDRDLLAICSIGPTSDCFSYF
jgi:hypothetical protein